MISTMIRKGKELIQQIVQPKRRDHAMKMIPRPETPKISTIVERSKKHDRKSMEQNLEKKYSISKKRTEPNFQNITFLKNEDGTLMICPPE